MTFTFPLIEAVRQGKQEGAVFNIDSSCRLIVHKSGFAYLTHCHTTGKECILDFFHRQIQIPQYFHLYNPPAELYATIRTDNRFGIKYRKRAQFRFLENQLHPGSRVIGSNGHFTAQIDAGNYEHHRPFELQLESRFWNSKNDFLDNGYGIFVYNREAVPVSLCYTACIVDHIAEIDIATLPEFRGKGYATLAALEFIRLSQSRNIHANWDCFIENTASLRLAQKLNFREMGTYHFLSIYKR